MIKCLILNMFIEWRGKPITAAERKNTGSAPHQNPRIDETKTFQNMFKAVDVIRKEGDKANG